MPAFAEWCAPPACLRLWKPCWSASASRGTLESGIEAEGATLLPIVTSTRVNANDVNANANFLRTGFRETVVCIGPHRVPLIAMDSVPNTEDDQTGFFRWPVSTLVSGLLLDLGSDALQATSVLDLGCGSGIAGLAASVCCSPHRVVLSDNVQTCRELAYTNSRLQTRSSCMFDVASYGWMPGDAWPSERGGFGLILASDCLYSSFDEVRSFEKWGDRYHDGRALIRFVATLDWCLSPGGTVLIGFDMRNSMDVERIVDALLEGGFSHQLLSAKDCLTDEMYSLPANAASHSAVVLRCSRVGEEAAVLVGAHQRRLSCRRAAAAAAVALISLTPAAPSAAPVTVAAVVGRGKSPSVY